MLIMPVMYEGIFLLLKSLGFRKCPVCGRGIINRTEYACWRHTNVPDKEINLHGGIMIGTMIIAYIMVPAVLIVGGAYTRRSDFPVMVGFAVGYCLMTLCYIAFLNVRIVRIASHHKMVKIPIFAAFLSVFFPGLGQIYVGEFKRSGLFIFLALLTSFTVIGFFIVMLIASILAYNSAKNLNLQQTMSVQPASGIMT